MSDTEQPTFVVDTYPDTLEGPDAVFHFGLDSQTFLKKWCKRAGSKVLGSMLILGVDGSVAILLASTGEVLTPAQIAKKSATPRVVGVPTRQ